MTDGDNGDEQKFHFDILDAIVVLSNWYDRGSKIRKVLQLAAAPLTNLLRLFFLLEIFQFPKEIQCTRIKGIP